VRIIGCAVVLLSGCGTFVNLWPNPNWDPVHGPFYSQNIVYGGVKVSLEEGAKSVTKPAGPKDFLAGVAWLTLDAPLSLVADTATLPITVSSQIERSAQADEFPENWRPSDGPPLDAAESDESLLEDRSITEPL
jgi:uncharacterized protein YceK